MLKLDCNIIIFEAFLKDMSRPVKLFYDVLSPYSWIAFEVLFVFYYSQFCS